MMKEYGIDAIPYSHEKLDEWRENFKGIRYLHEPTNLLITGAVDDIWVTPTGELIIVDYKATAKRIGPSTEEDLYDSYKRQMEIYQWLFRKNDFTVSPIGYFVYVNGKADAKAFDGKLEFDIVLIPYTGSDAWIEPTLEDLKKMLTSDAIPDIGKAFFGGPCDFCTYRETAGKRMLELHNGKR
jgi:RecB family exonuclease